MWRQLAGKGIATAFMILSLNAWGECYEEAGAKYGISPLLLKSIAMTESQENDAAISPRNKDGTRDYGRMQINSWWLDKIAAYGLSKDDLFDGCQSIHIGAWVLAQAIQAMGNNWEAVGAYNAGLAKNRRAARQVYANKVWINYVKLMGLTP